MIMIKLPVKAQAVLIPDQHMIEQNLHKIKPIYSQAFAFDSYL